MNITLDPANEVEHKIEVSETGEASQAGSKWKLHWRWEHLALGSVLMLSAFLGLWNLSINGYSNSYYAPAVKSMLQSWHNFFYASFDPGGYVSVDKPPVALWVQTAFAKVFGFNGVSLLLPEALAGVGGVFLVYLMVKRAFGTGAGLMSGLLLAITPIWVVMNRHNNPDSILVFVLILAAWAMLRAADKGRLRWLMLAGVLVGVAFNVKMLEAYVVLPAFYLMYFLFARTSWRKRILHLTLVSVVILAISFSWAIAVDLTPASERPYVGGSSTNSELDLILNYNGLNRVEGNEMGGGGNMPTFTDGTTATNNGSATQPTLPDGNATARADGGGPGGGAGFGGQAGATRLLVPQLAGEFNWFMPLALFGLIYLTLYAWFGMAKGEARSRRLQTVALWGGWWLIYGLVFSFSKGIFHNYYLIIMAPAQAALAGSALVMLWRRYRQGGWQGWLLPVALAATAFYQAYILTGFTSWNEWLGPVLIVLGFTALVGLGAGRFLRNQRFGRGLSRSIVWVSVVGLLVTPTIWSIKAVFTSIGGSLPSATPGSTGGGFGNSTSTAAISQVWLNFVGSNLSGQLLIGAVAASVAVLLVGLYFLFRRQRWFNLPTLAGVVLALFLVSSTGWWINVAQAQTGQSVSNTFSFANADGNAGRGGMGSTQADSKLVQYLVANQGDYKYLVAVSSSMQASPIILATDKPVMALGGFSGSDKIITSTTQLQALIANHTVRYFMVGGGGGPGGQSNTVSQYVQQTCKVVDSSLYSSSAAASTATGSGAQATIGPSTSDGRDGFQATGSGQLYLCS